MDGDIATGSVFHTGFNGQILPIESAGIVTNQEDIAVADTIVFRCCAIGASESFVLVNSVGDDDFVSVFTNERDVLTRDEGDTLLDIVAVDALRGSIEGNGIVALLDEDAEAGVLVAAAVGCGDSG